MRSAEGPEQLAGRGSEGQLVHLRPGEVPAQGVVDVGADAAVDVLGRVGDPLAPLGGPELGDRHLVGRGEPLTAGATRPARRSAGSPRCR